MSALHRTLEFSRAIFSVRELDELFPFLVDRLMHFMQAERGFLVRIEGGDKFEFDVSRDFEGTAVEHPEEQVSTTIIQEVIRSGKPVLVSNAGAHPSFQNRPSILRLELLSVLCAPLAGSRRGGILGAIYLDNRSEMGRFTQEDADMLALLANQAATAIENAQDMEELKSGHKGEAEDGPGLQVGRVAREVNSRFCDILAKIAGHLQVYAWTDAPNPENQNLKRIEEQTRKGIQLFRRLEGLYQPVEHERFQTFSMTGLVKSTVAGQQSPRNVQIVLDAREELCVKGDRHQIRAAIQEILKNARQALGDKEDGKIEVTLRSETNEVDLDFSDNGPGMSEKTLRRAGEPFFTTRPGSLGLGLSFARMVIQGHGGGITFKNRQGGGAIVTVRLPIPLDEKEARPPTLGRSARILLIDEEVEVADLLARSLASQGYQVQIATSLAEGESAIAVAVWDLVFIDAGIPKGNLDTLIRSARGLETPPKVILITAWAEWPHVSDVQGVDAIVAKPLQVRSLPRLIQRILENGAKTGPTPASPQVALGQ